MNDKIVLETTREVHAILTGIKALAADDGLGVSAASLSCLADIGLEKLEALWG